MFMLNKKKETFIYLFKEKETQSNFSKARYACRLLNACLMARCLHLDPRQVRRGCLQEYQAV
jgi:hypothetical protein